MIGTVFPGCAGKVDLSKALHFRKKTERQSLNMFKLSSHGSSHFTSSLQIIFSFPIMFGFVQERGTS